MIENIVSNNGHKYVDLDLPSGTLWSTCNVGAREPSESGLYFQWGDIQGYKLNQIGKEDGKKKFAKDWSDYKWNPSGDGKTFIKYTTKGDMLDLKDDAAHVYMGGSWHMPTPKQILELINNTTNDWITFDGVNGRLFTSKKDKSKSIFIPAAGVACDSRVIFKGSYGFIWSSMLSKYVDNGYNLNFKSNTTQLLSNYRSDGLPVRGVIG